MNAPTLKDISRVAGCHYTTVARALKGNPAIAKETRRHVLEVADQLGYRPDPMLQALVRYRHGVMKNRVPPVIAFVSHDPKGKTVQREHEDLYLKGAREQADALGYKVEYFWHGDPTISDNRWNQIFLARNIQMIITASFPMNVTHLKLDWDQFSAVRISISPAEPRLDTVSCNQMQMIRKAFQKLKELGYQRIGFLDIPKEDDRLGNMWTAGYAVEQAKLPAYRRIAPIIMPPQPTPKNLSAVIRKNKLDAVMSYAIPVYNLLCQSDISIPDDVAYASLNIMDTHSNPQVGGMRQSYFEVGKLAVNLVTKLHEANIRGLPRLPSIQYVEGEWVDGPTVVAKNNSTQTVHAELSA